MIPITDPTVTGEGRACPVTQKQHHLLTGKLALDTLLHGQELHGCCGLAVDVEAGQHKEDRAPGDNDSRLEEELQNYEPSR